MSYRVSRRACYFRLGEQLLALGSEHLRQVVTVGGLTRVPRVGSELLGLFSVRGAILPLIDLRPLLSLPVTPVRPTGTAALIDYKGQQLAFYLEQVVGFFPYEDVNATFGAELSAFTTGAVLHGELQAALLDVSEVMRALETQLVAA